jgi:hypothetical protein
MSSRETKPRDLRKYSRNTYLGLGLFGLIIIVIVGNILVRLFYGQDAMRLSISCMAVALLPGVLIILILAVMNWIARRYRDDGSNPG